MSRLDELKKNHETETPENDGPVVDYKAMNDYLVKEIGLEQEETVIGVISGVVEVGLQEQEDAKMEWTGTEEDERKEVAEKPKTYFETDNEGKRWKRWPVKPVETVIITVDFPEIIVDKGKFFGDSNPAPLRLCLNGLLWLPNEQTMVNRGYPMTLRKNDKTHGNWSMLPNNTLYKIAVGAKVINAGEPFLPQDVIKLLGKALLFKVRVYYNKEYYTEKITYAAGLMRGQVAPSLDENLLFYVGFNSDNDDTSLKYLTKNMINRMKMSPNWEESKIKEQIEKRNEPYKKDDDCKEEQNVNEVKEDDEYDGSEIPF